MSKGPVLPPSGICWPSPQRRLDRGILKKTELRAIAIFPAVTGLGRHPRTVADEDWVLQCENYIKDLGLEQFLVDLLEVLRQSALEWLGVPPAELDRLGNYPRRYYEGEVPLPTVSMVEGTPGAMHSPAIAFALNPASAGVPPFVAAVPQRTWIAAVQRLSARDGLRQTLVNFVYLLRETYGFPGGGRGKTFLFSPRAEDPTDDDDE